MNGGVDDEGVVQAYGSRVRRDMRSGIGMETRARRGWKAEVCRSGPYFAVWPDGTDSSGAFNPRNDL